MDAAAVPLASVHWSDKWFGFVGVDAPDVAAAKRRAVLRALLVVVAADLWSQHERHLYVAVLLTICAVAAWSPKLERGAAVVASGLLAAVVVGAFPTAANHAYLAFICIGVLALCRGDDPAEAAFAVQALRWVVVIGVFYSGLQKLLYGYYFRGEVLAHAISVDPEFAAFFAHLVPTAEIERLQSGIGPFRIDSTMFVVVVNATWISELVLSLALLCRRTRRLAAYALIGLLFGIELAAREVFFGGVMLSLILLFTPTLNRRALPVVILFYAYVVAMIAGIAPSWEFT